MAVTISQDADIVDLVWVEGDPISLAFTVADVNWSGSYTAQVRASTDPDATLLLSLTVTATYSAPDTAFTLAANAAASAAVTAGRYVWDMQQVNGVTRLRGVVRVEPQVTR